jgi:transposase-like protein
MEDPMPTCPRCQTSERQVKASLNRTGTQRLLCCACGRSYTPEPEPTGYEESVRRRDLMLYAGGMSLREAGRFAGVNHQTVANGVEAACVLSKESEESGSFADSLIIQVVARRGYGASGEGVA